MSTERKLVRERVDHRLRHQIVFLIGLPVGQPTAIAQSVTGESYVTMTNGGIKPQGETFPVFAETRAAALEGYIRACGDYAHTRRAGGRAVLYWRRYPSILEFDDGTWVIYSRLLVSDKPALAEAERAAA